MSEYTCLHCGARHKPGLHVCEVRLRDLTTEDALLARADHAQEQADRLREQCEEARRRAEAAEGEMVALRLILDWSAEAPGRRLTIGPRPGGWEATEWRPPAGHAPHGCQAATLRELVEMLGIGGES